MKKFPIRWIGLVLLHSCMLNSASFALAAGSSFWSEAVPSPDTRYVYVSSSEGSDSSSGLSVDHPVRSLGRAMSLMRDGYPDRLLLKRGDVWYESFGGWTLSGRSESEPMIIGAYGSASDRPHLRLTNERAMYLIGSPKHLWITSMRMTAATPTWRQGILFHYSGSDGEDLLFEDLYIEGFNGNIMVDETNAATSRYKNMRFRRVTSVDAVLFEDGELSTSTGTQGLFLSYTDGTLIEECIFDHNGRSHDPEIQISGLFAHNLYISADNQNFQMRGTISASAGSHGIKCMSGGVIRDCLFLRNPINIMLGHDSSNPGGSISFAEGNVILDSQAIDTHLPRGAGIQLLNLRDSSISNNIIAGLRSQATGGKGLSMVINNTNAMDHVEIANNTIVDWFGSAIHVDLQESVPFDVTVQGNRLDTRSDGFMYDLSQFEVADSVLFQSNVYYADPIPFFARIDQSYLDHSQWQAFVYDLESVVVPFESGLWGSLSIERYQASLGQEPTLDAFMEQARQQRRGDWDHRYTAESVQTYCQETVASIVSGEHPDDLCIGDANDDRKVDLVDVTIFFVQYGLEGPGLAADFDNDGIVGVQDFSVLLIHFGDTCKGGPTQPGGIN